MYSLQRRAQKRDERRAQTAAAAATQTSTASAQDDGVQIVSPTTSQGTRTTRRASKRSVEGEKRATTAVCAYVYVGLVASDLIRVLCARV
jgi:hypothetical protein